jgi:hypothetical protein
MLLNGSGKTAITVLIAAMLAGAVGCARKADDSQIARSVQTQIQNDSAIGGQVTVQSADGVVTLNGQVPSDAARALAAREAADAPGVKQVINNLIVTPSAGMAPATATPPAAGEAGAAAPAEKPAQSAPARRSPARRQARPAQTENVATNTPPAQAAAPAPAQTQAAAPPEEPAPVEAPAPLPPPPAPVRYTVPAGTTLSVRLIDSLDSGRNKPGDTFRATLNSPIRMNGDVLVPAGADVEGRVLDATNAGRYTGKAEMKLALTKLTWHGHTYPLNTEAFQRAGEGRGKGTAEAVGGAAAVGAIIGAIAGGGKGAAIGGLAGAGAGGAARGVIKGKGITFPSESVLSFTLQGPVTVVTMPGENEPPR